MLIRKTLQNGGMTPIVIPEQAGSSYINFGLLALDKNAEYGFNSGNREYVGVILGGICDILGSSFGWKHAGERENVFRGKATAFYLPPGHDCRIVARTRLTIAMASAETDVKSEPAFVEPDDVITNGRGKENFYRHVHDIFDNRHYAGHLMVGETFNPPGNWSSYPPHRHEENNPPHETELEEVYFFKIAPPQGFGLQYLYTDDDPTGQVIPVRDNDTVFIKRGYHPVIAAPGYQLYYLWVLAGPVRKICRHDDPRHRWVDPPKYER